jgi:Tfp pilus tip-associated adhesin PilY1
MQTWATRYGKPTITRFSNNKWYAVFPNGTDSNGDKASVFVVNLTNACGLP